MQATTDFDTDLVCTAGLAVLGANLWERGHSAADA
jgi:hypothetical protein